MSGFFIFLHVLVCFFLVITILLQSAKGGGLAGSIGGDVLGGTSFGGRGAATFLSRTTTILAVMFMLLSISNNLFMSGAIQAPSLIQEAARESGTAPISPSAGLPAIPGAISGDQAAPAETPTSGAPATESNN